MSSSFHQKSLDLLSEQLGSKGIHINSLISKIATFQIAVPSWALGAGGTRFGRFSIGGEPRNLEEKLEDIGLLAKLTKRTDAVSLHIPWDIPQDVQAIRQKAADLQISFDAMNSNTFQDYGQPLSYKMGSLSNADPAIRKQAVEHNLQVIEIGKSLGSKGLTVWLADGSNFPGQAHIRKALQWTTESLKEIYASLPADWKLLLEYKPYEPNFYHTVIPDWGTSALICRQLGDRAKVLVDLGHHLPNTNIEQIVATLMHQNLLAGFHFNDSKYGDDDLSTGSVKPYQLFLIFCELIGGAEENAQTWESISWMIDASHNTKDPLEDLIQALEAISQAYAKALLVDRKKLALCQNEGDVVGAQEVLQDAFLTDVRTLVCEARIQSGGEADPLAFYRKEKIRAKLIAQRGKGAQASGL
ncbi:L-rhamnose isomerase / sugar isomerase [Algoriphagus alkaliphilus]|uniref:L-rhamnose isomerase / sugar isomerase n=1 Tax=Algoriphagus alkaliphilus TaxID=279824 RepID=A0A1G5Y0T9_9BACT|nr:TIM barrel protein [Algoriphagus alkaliphilus]SDA75816.1 L-rhamnose isomerase / sugar isomerase [Algoriphagus alkaliphilus]